MSYYDDHEFIEVVVKCRHATDEVVEFTGEEIIRCKECIHWYRALDESGTIERFNFSRCTKGHSGNGLEFYCADGEREGE